MLPAAQQMALSSEQSHAGCGQLPPGAGQTGSCVDLHNGLGLLASTPHEPENVPQQTSAGAGLVRRLWTDAIATLALELHLGG